MIQAGSWGRLWMMPEGLSLFLSLSSRVRTGTEGACGDSCGQDLVSYPTSLPKSDTQSSEQMRGGPSREGWDPA